MNEKNDESLMADNFLSGQRVKHLVLFIEQHKKIEETKWLADFMENEVAYLIERAEKFRYSFSSINMDISRSSAWLWAIVRAVEGMSGVPCTKDPQKVIEEWRKTYSNGVSHYSTREMTIKVSLDTDEAKRQIDKLIQQYSEGLGPLALVCGKCQR
ncbi:hypothetical protein VC585_10545 [Citrobacter freundii]|uniref:hypothetical protein n=1 Tax=Citrobacter freundii complex TaxID=1344959 RepID=UPI0024E12497|nr:hypothetical protein [Citrobacter freundii]MDV0628416.1 hypothetical protein [Citrobacter freundii]MDV0633725.1 hypothetical protein [Citrobacter freundii]MDV0644823.1 hypothetical protein [Citrobacter freundii]MDV0665193.1 hypothetical protein [Citrobacter freundii]MDV0670300.1 hypothetical protein [Citrobacter freundii]